MRLRTLILVGAAYGLLSSCASTRAITPQAVEQSVDWDTAAQTEVLLTSFEFTPRVIELEAGTPVRLLITNQQDGHDFTAPDFFAAARIASGDLERVANGQVNLREGESIALRLIPEAGRYDVVCTRTGHALLGMRGEIVVR